LTNVGYVFHEDDYSDLSQFADADLIPEWVLDLASLNVGLGIVNGTEINGKLYIDCEGLTTAEQALMMFYRSYLKASGAELAPPEETVPPTEETVPPTEETEPPIEETQPTEPQPNDGHDPSVRFSNAADWAIEELEKLDELGIVTDTVAYSSMTGPITRGEMAKIAVRTWKVLTFTPIDQDLGTNGQNPFTDTSDPDIIAAYLLGIVSGDGNGKFRPNDSLTRQEYFKISVNLLASIGYMFSDDEEILLEDFTDGEDISEWAQAATRLLIGIGVVKGSDNCLNPDSTIVTQEALAIFSRIHNFVTTWVTVEDQEEADQADHGRGDAEGVVDQDRAHENGRDRCQKRDPPVPVMGSGEAEGLQQVHDAAQDDQITDGGRENTGKADRVGEDPAADDGDHRPDDQVGPGDRGAGSPAEMRQDGGDAAGHHDKARDIADQAQCAPRPDQQQNAQDQ